MEPITFYMDQEGCREYFKALQVTPGTRCHTALKSNRRMLVLLLAVITLMTQMLRKPTPLQFVLSVSMVVVVAVLMWVLFLPWSQIHNQVAQFKRRGNGKESFRQLHKIWTDNQFYYHQVGEDMQAKPLELTTLKHVQMVNGGVVLRFTSTDDFVPGSAFGETLTAEQFAAMMQDASTAAGDAAVARELPVNTAAEQADAEQAAPAAEELLRLSYQCTREENLDLLCEAHNIIMRSKQYWSARWQILIMLPLIFVIWIQMEAPLLLLFLLIAVGVVLVFSPTLGRKRREREMKLGRMDRFLGAQEMIFTADRFYMSNATGNTSFQYQYVPNLMEGKLGIYLVGKNGKGCLPVPRAAFENEEAANQFVAMYRKLVQDHSAKKK